MDVIRLDQVSLWRRTQEEFSYDLKKTVLSVIEGQYRKPGRKLVLDRINLSVQHGDRIGIIGANGAGKSTLLKVICGILEPTQGTVSVLGKIAPLIELGAGFDLELTVVDNIILYGVLLGFPKKAIARRIEFILDFAELEDYARVPLKSLSSGMKARLGFAIATDVEPSLLILDEVLSVGDIHFRNKCYQRIQKFWQTDTTILVVSHDTEFIRQWCDRAVWLDQGRIKFIGPAERAIAHYLDSVEPGLQRLPMTADMSV